MSDECFCFLFVFEGLVTFYQKSWQALLNFKNYSYFCKRIHL